MATTYKELDKGTFIKRNEAAQARKTAGSWDSWKPQAAKAGSEPARNVIRILPPHANMEDVFIEVKIHFLPSKEQDKSGRPVPIGINCLAQYGEDCPACEHVDRLYKAARGEDDPEEQKKQKDLAYGLGAKVRLFANIVDIAHPEKKVQRYAFGPDVEKKLRSCFFDDDGEFRNITHPKTGRDVIMLVVKKQGTDFNEYVTVKAKDSASALGDMDWLEEINDLSELTAKPSLDDMKKALEGERPASQQKSKPAAAAAPAAVKPEPAKAAEPSKKKTTAEETVPGKQPKQPAPVEKPKRQPVEEDEPYAAALAAIEESSIEFVPTAITPAETERIKKPACYTKETDLSDPACQGCRVLLPCLTAKLLAEA